MTPEHKGLDFGVQQKQNWVNDTLSIKYALET
jgi:hypothetical protein